MTPHQAKEMIDELKFRGRQVDRKMPPESEQYLPHWKLAYAHRAKQATFDFWNDLENKPPKKVEALAVILDTATEGLGDIDEFFHEHKYEDRPTEGLAAYQQSKALAEKVKAWLGVSDEDVYMLAETANRMKSE